MKVVIVSPNNYYGLPGALARRLRAVKGISAEAFSYEEPSYGYQVDTVLRRADGKELLSIVERIMAADIVHVFDQGFSVDNFVLEKHLNRTNAVVTYTPEYFSQQWGSVFFRHFRSDVVATGWPVTPPYNFCPLPLIHLPPVIDLAGIPEPAPQGRNGRLVVALASHYGDRHSLDRIFEILWSLRAQYDFSINWLENLSREDYLAEFSRSDLFIDSLRFSGPTPLGLEALAAGLVVLTTMTGLDFSLYSRIPVVPVGLNSLSATLTDLLLHRGRVADLKIKSAAWIKARCNPEEVTTQWVALYHHVKSNGGRLDSTPYC